MLKVTKSLLVVLAGLGLTLGVASCGEGKAPSPRAASPTTTPTTMLPKPTGTPVLEITRPGAEPVSADFATLDGLAHKTYRIVEPFEEKEIAFKGVELWSVLAAAGVPASATEIKVTALDDYQVTLSVADLRQGGVILATQADGALIPVDHGGPTRVVFLKDVKAGINPDQWIWSLKRIAVS